MKISALLLKSMALTLHQSGHGHSHGGLGSKGHGHSHKNTEESNQISNGDVDLEHNTAIKGMLFYLHYLVTGWHEESQ